MTSAALSDLDERSLKRLRDALTSGLLKVPFSRFTLARLVSQEHLDPLEKELKQQQEEGLTPSLLLFVVDSLLQQRRSLQKKNKRLELVMTGPELPGSYARDTGVVVRQIFANATRSIFLCGFAVYQGKEIFSALGKRMQENPSIQVRLCLNIGRKHNDPTPSALLIKAFQKDFRDKQWPDDVDIPEVYFDPRALEDSNSGKCASLHAKFVIADEQHVFLSSANFTEAAQQRNIEAGVITDDDELAKDLSRHFERLIQHGHLKKLRWPKQK